MAHAPAVGHALAGTLGSEFGLPMEETFNLSPRDNSPAGNSTVNMFVNGASNEFEYAASIISACADQTVYAIQCTAGPKVDGFEPCGSSAPIIAVTSGASAYAVSTAVTSKGVAVNVQETCALAGTTAATCTATAMVSAGTTSTSSVAVSTLTGTDYQRFDVTITAGAEKTQNPTVKCPKNAALAHKIPKTVIWALAGVVVASIHTLL